MSIPDFPKFVAETLDLLRPHAEAIMEAERDPEHVPPDDAQIDRDMAIIGAYSNMLCLHTFLRSGLVKVVDGPQVEGLKAVKKAAAEFL